MESIAAAIKASLVPFLASKLEGVVDEESLSSMIDEWFGVSTPIKKRKAKPPPAKKVAAPVDSDEGEASAKGEMTRSDYEKMKVSELKAICKERGIAQVGNKPVLIDKLLGIVPATAAKASPGKGKRVKSKETVVTDTDDDEPQPPKNLKKKVDKYDADTDDDEPQPPKRLLKKKADKAPVPKVVEMIQPPTVDLVYDKYGNAVHEPTGLVFNSDDEAIGKVDGEGMVVKLKKADIEVCKQRHIAYRLHSDYEDDEED